MTDDEKNQQEINKIKNKKSLVSEKIGIILPQLIARNSKLSDRIKNKIRVSNFLNKTENRNQRYLKSFVSSSEKRVKDIKIGQDLFNAIKQSNKNLHPLYTEISNDLAFKNLDILIKEKRLLKENTEQETHSKINDLIHDLKSVTNNNHSPKIKPLKKQIKSLSETELNKAKSIINYRIKKEGNLINHKIQGYLDKLNDSPEEKKKEFINYVDKIDIFDNLKLINYMKPKPLELKDKECPSIVRIKKQIFQNMGTLNKKNYKKNKKRKYLNLRNISTDFSISKDNNKNNCNLTNNTNIKSDILKNDSLKLLNNLTEQNKNLSSKINKSMSRINTLIDNGLPHPNIYELILQKNKEKLSKINDNNKNETDNKKIEESLKSTDFSDPNLLSKNKLEKIVKLFKKEVDVLKNEKEDFKYFKKYREKYNIRNPLIFNLNRIKKHNKKRNDNNINNIQKSEYLSTDNLVLKKLKKKNDNICNNYEKDSNLYSSSKIYESFSMISNSNNNKSYITENDKIFKK